VKTLSPKQRRLLDFIRDYLEEKDRPPTIREMVRGCGISSTSVVDYNLNILEREGYIRRDAEVSRGIELLGRRRGGVPVPLIGLIAAGEPIPVPSPDAWTSDSFETLELPQEMTRGKENVYALKVKGNSMIDALIGDGDVVLMQAASTAENGEMVATWLKREKEVTLKRLYREKGRIRLQPANEQMKPIYVRPDNVEIQGRVVGIIRFLD
jgi:repressor LexA